MNSTRKPETFDKPAVVANRKTKQRNEFLAPSIKDLPCAEMRDREGELLGGQVLE